MHPSASTAGPIRPIPLLAGPLAFLALRVLAPGGLDGPQATVLGVAAWMAVWWISECLPLAVTALLPIALFPALGATTAREATAPFANEVVYLYLGGFLLAEALQRWRAHERIAFAVILRVGTESRRLVLGVMLATAVISMWISNTATAAMMYPIALAIGARFGDDAAARSQQIALLLGVAFAASIGGMATLIGTPPNLILAGAAREPDGTARSSPRAARTSAAWDIGASSMATPSVPRRCSRPRRNRASGGRATAPTPPRAP